MIITCCGDPVPSIRPAAHLSHPTIVFRPPKSPPTTVYVRLVTIYHFYLIPSKNLSNSTIVIFDKNLVKL